MVPHRGTFFFEIIGWMWVHRYLVVLHVIHADHVDHYSSSGQSDQSGVAYAMEVEEEASGPAPIHKHGKDMEFPNFDAIRLGSFAA